MQLYLGGACAGKRALIRQRFPHARWHSADAAAPLSGWRQTVVPGGVLVIAGWETWLAERLGEGVGDETDDDRLRRVMACELQELRRAEGEHRLGVVLIVEEMGCGIVPMGPARRRLRDLNGWLAQDAASLCDDVWYVWHGLARALKR